jgi:hypothetical protein
VYCADLFPERADWRQNPDGTYSFSIDIDGVDYPGCAVQTVWSEVYAEIDQLYAEIGSLTLAFDALIGDLGLGEVVYAVRGNSARLTAMLPISFACKLAYIDGEHSYEAVRCDILNVEPFIVEGGWLCFDDAFSGYSGVDCALDELVLGRDGFGDFRQLTRKLFVARKQVARCEPVGATS